VEPVVTHRSSWLESTGVNFKSTATIAHKPMTSEGVHPNRTEVVMQGVGRN